MKVNLIAIGTKMPRWVNEGFESYAKRLPPEFQLNLIEIAAGKRLKSTNLNQLIEQESNQLLKAAPRNDLIIALDRKGDSLDTQSLTNQLVHWQNEKQSISMLIGGPEGLSRACLQRATHIWSLSQLTLPHPLVRVLVAEQIYRAWSIITHHPYHR